jgi:23S rRNA (uracil1939-C5)-methyltransferase
MAETFTIKMEKMVYGGDCLGRLPDGRAVFVPFVLPGELVRVEINEDKKRYAHARPVDLIQASPDRIIPKCRHFGECGGCQYQHLSYEKQCQLKEALVKDQFKRIGKMEEIPLQPIIPSPEAWHYRNHVQFHLSQAGELGYIHADAKHLLLIDECHLPQKPINALWPQINLGQDTNIFRMGIRMDTEESLMLILEGEEPEPPEFDVDIPISAVYTPPEANLTVLAGEDHLIYTLLGHSLQVSARSFFQVNTAMAEKMIQFLLAHLAISKNTTVLELYAGVGLFSAFIAPRVDKLTAIESSGSACHDFTVNLDDFDNISLYEAPVEDALPHITHKIDLLIADPPRSGLAPQVHDALNAIDPAHIAYISCDPATLARDIKKILSRGYTLISVTPFDLFPQTAHVETIVLLDRK